MKRDQLGLTATTIKVVLILIISFSLMGLLVSALLNKKPAEPATTTVSSDGVVSSADGSQKNWKTYKSKNGLGVGFSYPSGWTVGEADTAKLCTKQVQTRITASDSDTKAAFKALGVSYLSPQEKDTGQFGSLFQVDIIRGGQGSTCSDLSDGTIDLTGKAETKLLTLDTLKAGAFKGKSLTLYGPVDGRDKAIPDSLAVTNNKYAASATSFTDSAIVSTKQIKYQITPIFGNHYGGYTMTIGLNDSKLKGTTLYKNLVGILNSLH